MRRWIVGGIFFLPAIGMIIEVKTLQDILIALGLTVFAFTAAHIVFYPDHPFSKKVSDLF